MSPRAVFHKVLCGFVGLFLSARVGAAESDLCRSVNFEGNDYTVCEADLRKDVIQLFGRKGMGVRMASCKPCRNAWMNTRPAALCHERGNV
jgi:uncharacterized protein YigE (DUF2233 family)